MGDTPELNQDYLDMLAELVAARVEFVVVGAHAMAVHGVPRATGDVDILVRPSRDNAARVMRALRAFGAPLDAHGVQESDFATPGNIYQIGLPPRRIDILTSISGVTFDEAWDYRVTVQRSGLDVAYLGREQLIRNKRATGRDKDQVDLALLER